MVVGGGLRSCDHSLVAQRLTVTESDVSSIACDTCFPGNMSVRLPGNMFSW